MANAETRLNEQILAAANSLFVDKGYDGMSMREIAEALGVSKPAVYYYFKDKEELFLAILKKYLDDMSGALDRIAAEPVACQQKICSFAEYVLTQPAEQRATIRLASQEVSHLSPESRAAFNAIYHEQFIGKLQAIFQAGMDTGEFRRIHPDVAVWALLGIMFPYFYPTHSGNLPVPAEIIDEVVGIYLAGVCK
ncbi:MAG: TetR/AcrR family transcriptional regulator [Anaerolineaceae bacterium]|nr:TetR/AcrR family transcriptional regulator [Anaerolineaceae bacterium]